MKWHDGLIPGVGLPEWQAEIDQELILISVRAGNNLGLPSQAVLTALEGRIVLRMDVKGTIDIATNVGEWRSQWSVWTDKCLFHAGPAREFTIFKDK